MATNPVPVQQSAATAVRVPDIWRSFRTEMDRLFDGFAGAFGPARFPSLAFDTALTAASPASDLTESDAGYKLTAELPGISEKDVDIAVTGDTLTIRGEKVAQREENEKNAYLCERAYGAFQRSFVLPPDIDRDSIAAEFANGVLTVTLPRTAQAAPKQIEVKRAA